MVDVIANDPFETPETPRYFEDYITGSVYEFGPVDVEEEEIIAFAKKFDSQDFHIDPVKARDTAFGGLIASGWHTGSLMTGLYVKQYLSGASSLGSPGMSQLRWLVPVRPGDKLTVRVHVRETRLSKSKPERGIVNSDIEMLNQDGVVVMDLSVVNMIATRASAAS